MIVLTVEDIMTIAIIAGLAIFVGCVQVCVMLDKKRDGGAEE
jgi:hypothetical protein